MQGSGVIDIGLRGFGEAVCNLHFGFTEDNAGLALTLSLRLLRHGIFQSLRDDNITDLNTLNRDTPGGGALVNDLLQLFVHNGATYQDFRKSHLADDFSQGSL